MKEAVLGSNTPDSDALAQIPTLIVTLGVLHTSLHVRFLFYKAEIMKIDLLVRIK